MALCWPLLAAAVAAAVWHYHPRPAERQPACCRRCYAAAPYCLRRGKQHATAELPQAPEPRPDLPVVSFLAIKVRKQPTNVTKHGNGGAMPHRAVTPGRRWRLHRSTCLFFLFSPSLQMPEVSLRDGINQNLVV